MDISVVIPVYNEEANLPELHARLTPVLQGMSLTYEIIFVNDGSKDRSLEVMMMLAGGDAHVRWINFSRNFGHQIAVTAGMDRCKGQAVVIMDADLQDPPELIPALYSRYKEGFDVVGARRAERKGESPFKKWTAKIFYRIMRRMVSFSIPLDTGDFRIIDRKVMEYLGQMPEQNKFLRGQIAWLGFHYAEVVYTRDRRKHGKTGYSLGKMLRFAMDGMTSFSDKPLAWVSRLGIGISFFSFLIILYAMFSHFILQRTITGWTSLIISSMFIGGVQLISVGIIGEYISRINRNVLKRPLYVVEGTNIK